MGDNTYAALNVVAIGNVTFVCVILLWPVAGKKKPSKIWHLLQSSVSAGYTTGNAHKAAAILQWFFCCKYKTPYWYCLW